MGVSEEPDFAVGEQMEEAVFKCNNSRSRITKWQLFFVTACLKRGKKPTEHDWEVDEEELVQ